MLRSVCAIIVLLALAGCGDRRSASSAINAFAPAPVMMMNRAVAADKKAENLVALDLRGISTFTDFFVICSGTSEPHLKAIAGEIEHRLKADDNVAPAAVDGYPMSHWIVIDYTDVVVHIFHEQKRGFYSLEDLWSDAPRLALT